MKEDKTTGKQAGSSTNTDIDTLAFIRQVSAGGMRAETAQSAQAVTQTDTDSDVSESMEEKSKEQPKSKRGQTVDYESLFLVRNEICTRQGLYIDRENYEILQTLIRAIRSERLSISGLVDNIVSHHIELYGDEMNRIYDDNSRKPIKKKT
jgi:hypothetical protein